MHLILFYFLTTVYKNFKLVKYVLTTFINPERLMERLFYVAYTPGYVGEDYLYIAIQ